MGKTYFSVSVDDAAESWRAIRSHRAAPSVSLAKVLRGQRKEVFHVALEQSQQQFRAASAVGYESRPLNLFYGLAQAGRAVCAASAELGPGSSENTWLPAGGHGLSFNPTLTGGMDLLGATIEQRSNSADAFSRLSHALRSPLDFDRTTFGSLLSHIPETYLEFRRTDWGPVALMPNGIYGANLQAKPYPIAWEIQAPGLDTQAERTTASARAWMSQYPTLRPLDLKTDLDGNPSASHNLDRLELLVPAYEFLDHGAESHAFPLGSQLYRRHRILLPVIGSSDHAAHPLASWWMLLFALSMLARYSPRDWSAVMSIRESPIASVVEHLLDTAIDAVPNLLAESLDSLNDR
jgi:hypothetical protein